ncbi:MAG: plasmid mobilization protein [Dysosmobacter sp.]
MNKDVKFSTRMTSQNRAAIKALAAKAGMSMSDYVTACCLGKRIVVIDEQKKCSGSSRASAITSTA